VLSKNSAASAGTVQAYCAPATEELAVSTNPPDASVIQVFSPPVAIRSGSVIFWFTMMAIVEVQPFTGFVTVNKYDPGVLVVGFFNEEVNPPGPVQL
jgi:hypothetical protein